MFLYTMPNEYSVVTVIRMDKPFKALAKLTLKLHIGVKKWLKMRISTSPRDKKIQYLKQSKNLGNIDVFKVFLVFGFKFKVDKKG